MLIISTYFTFVIAIVILQTLDGEMQKLVYDNYNKFINATETIKEMKNGVFRMDQDMDAVKWVKKRKNHKLFIGINHSSGKILTRSQ